MKIYIATELGSAYRLEDGNLQYAHISKDSTFDSDSFDYVEPELICDEIIQFQGKQMPFNEAYKIITDCLSK